MSNSGNSTRTVTVLLLVVSAAIAIYLVCNQGYGAVHRTTYDMATAVYGACLSKSKPRLEKLQQMLDENSEATSEMPARERDWIQQMIRKAQNGKWESAASNAKRMMQDQVEY